MKPLDYRNATWAEVESRVEGLRKTVWEAMLADGGAHTTREWAEILRIDLLTVRPRITELCDIGFVELEQERAGCPRSREGRYRARSPYMAMYNYQQRCTAAREPQLELKF